MAMEYAIRRTFPLAVLSAAVLLGCTADPSPEKVAAAPAASGSDACSFPTSQASTPEETAWRVFVAAVCPTGDPQNPLVFEEWTEQTCIADPTRSGCGESSRERRLRGSAFAAKRSGLPNFETCGQMTTKGTSPALDPFVPTSGPGALGSNPKFCEEVYVNDAELDYVRKPAPGFSLTTHQGQASFITAGNTIDMPTAAVEVKADWLPATSLATPFTCAKPPAGVFTEEVDGVCYALAGIHVTSKLYPNWVWATFEPQSNLTNPNRCRADLYGECFDSWGASPATNGHATTTDRTQALKDLMAAAKLDPAFDNYRMTGVQIEFTDGVTVTHASKTDQYNLGNSFVEFNAQVQPGKASCISCHSSAQLNAQLSPPVEQTLQEFTGPPPHGGVNYPPDPPYSTQDFSWLLGDVL